MNAIKKLFWLLLCLTFSAGAQTWQVRKADRYFEAMQYAEAAQVFETISPQTEHTLSRLADCYQRLNDSPNAEQAYAKLVVTGKATPGQILYYAQALHQNAKYREAREQYQAYLKLASADRRSAKNVEGLSDVTSFFSDSLDVKLSYLDINTPNEDFAPAFYKGGLAYVSDSKKTSVSKRIFGWNSRSFLNIYFLASPDVKIPAQGSPRLMGSSDRTVQEYAVATRDRNNPFQELNSIYHEGPMVFFASGDRVIFTRNNYHNKKYKTDKSGVNRLKLFMASRVDGVWTNVQPLSINSDDFSVGHPALSPDEKTLYFISDKPGGFGETDLYKVSMDDGKLGEPVNAGPTVNTEGREMFPFVDDAGNLFFASDGHGGLGGLDNFYAELIESEFAEPVNLGYPINTNLDDFGIIVDHTNANGFLASYRHGGQTRDDIYSFSSAKPLIKKYYLNGSVADFNSHEKIDDASVTLLDEGGRELKTVTAVNGAFIFRVAPGKTYTLRAGKDQFKPGAQTVSTIGMKQGQPMSATVLLEKIGAYALVCQATDAKTKSVLDSVKVHIINNRTGALVMSGLTSNGSLLRSTLDDVRKDDMADYKIELSRKGYLSKSANFNVVFKEPGDVAIHQLLDVSLSPIEKGIDIGKILHMKPIYFELGKSTIKADAALELDKIVAVMLENPGMTIELESHTDSRGSDAMNLALSDQRAKASAAYIVSKGIASSRIVGKGYGETKLLNKCASGVKCTEAEHQLNRRTEFIITSLGNP
jgi:outer membrane protein OmpA-like peptidoglycan-associated protein/tetratricopeptide (TPR) repeat protein